MELDSDQHPGSDQDPCARVCAALDATGFAYELFPCDPDHADTEVFCAEHGVALEDSANTIVVASKSGVEQRFAACVLLATTRLDVNKTVRKRLGVRRISFASPEQTREVTGMVLGGVAPFGLPENLPVWIDSAVLARDSVVIGGGDRAHKISVTARVFLDNPNVEVVEGLALAR
ncbi:MAG: prolyl-tRNA editing enzyme YbaK/EbsC (Cys-tRNA(Pro) deacylase) [Gammaproteobacteria bacterium]|jgi:prolyl-tRNA editing enzyme YbaK/EbsC (Cys-tRNA(Pro) deacylase)